MEKYNPKISVIVPVYRVEAYLRKCINSLINQTYTNMDIILVDDGSPDNCPIICDQYAEKFENIKVLHKKNGGLSSARNYGVCHTESEWIVFVDSDDYVEPDYVETLVNLRNQFDAEMVVTRTVREKEDGSGKATHKIFNSYLADSKTALYQIYSGINVGWAAYGKLIQRKALLKYPFPDGYYEDCACMYKIISEVNRIAIGDFENNYHYIQREGSILTSRINEKHLQIFEIAKEFEKYIKISYPEMDILIVLFYRSAVVQLLNLVKMPWSSYKEIFMKYRPFFRKNVGKILSDSRITRNIKVYYLLLCGRPEIYCCIRKILIKVRQ